MGDGRMNWTRALAEMITHDDRLDRTALFAAIARDTVYLPSELAARLLPLDLRPANALSWDRSAPGADLPAPAR
jgi:hypothetical protein